MHLFLSDETNTTQTGNVQFLIYGAVVVPMVNAAAAVQQIIAVREKAGYPAGAEFKFDSRSRPPSVTKEDFDAAKCSVLEIAERHGMRFMACVVHHEIAAKIQARERPLFALKTLLNEFDLFLAREKTSGICVVDRFEIAHSVLSSILTGGVDPSGRLGRFQRNLSNVLLYSVSSINCSHLCSVCDITLGSFRYCANAVDRLEVPRKIYPRVRKLFFHQPSDPNNIENWGLFLRPKNVRVKTYADAYDRLRRHLLSLETPSK